LMCFWVLFLLLIQKFLLGMFVASKIYDPSYLEFKCLLYYDGDYDFGYNIERINHNHYHNATTNNYNHMDID
jgi:hypothetical protein